jgi:hypothetical protein
MTFSTACLYCIKYIFHEMSSYIYNTIQMINFQSKIHDGQNEKTWYLFLTILGICERNVVFFKQGDSLWSMFLVVNGPNVTPGDTNRLC